MPSYLLQEAAHSVKNLVLHSAVFFFSLCTKRKHRSAGELDQSKACHALALLTLQSAATEGLGADAGNTESAKSR